MAVNGICKRCGKTAKLCRSHIIPEGAFRTVYDEHSRALTINSEGSTSREVQQGAWEYMFCRDCEDFFEDIETPFQRFWKHPTTLPSELTISHIFVQDVDYENTKRFLLSVLWRSHVTSRPEFSGVDLGLHANKIDALLRSSAPILASVYSVFGYVLKNIETDGPDDKVLVTPARFRVGGHRSYVVAFLGIAWLIVISSHKVDLPQSCLLEPRKALLLPVVSTRDFGPIRQIYRERSSRIPNPANRADGNRKQRGSRRSPG
ncbi:MAG TPA: hypothetical protein VF789_24480 [Thermoanaerobaculia bacterium]